MNRTSDWICRLICVVACGLVVAGCTDTPPAAKAPASRPDTAAAPAADTVEPQLLSDDLLAEGWISLFDGLTLFGWQHDKRADWRVEDGAIVVENGDMTLLTTTTQFADYVLHVEFLRPPGTNSGVFLATTPDPQDAAADCYELNIADGDHPFPTGSLVDRQAVPKDLNRPEWQTFEVHVQTGHIVVWLDGQQVLDYTDPQPLLRGHVGLQHNQGRIAFRNIRLRPLGLEAIFNGHDLTGWKEYPELASRFTVTEDGTLNVQNGRGQLESEKQYGDFLLQLECISHAPGLNSGIFFRCVPGEDMNGYESQIHNVFKNGDRTQPADCGTGGIFRRVDARRVVADDLQWFHKTIVAHGPHVAVWVNGYQVTDWTDTRPADPNPRKGLRLDPGTIMIQGHDPTTNLSFRNLRAAEMAVGRE